LQYRLWVNLALINLRPILLGAAALLGACAAPPAADDLPGRGPLISVVDEAGGPVPDAELWLVDRRTLRADAAVLASRITGDWVETSLQLAAEVQRTDGRGRARLQDSPAPGVFLAARSGALFGSVEVRAIGREGLVLSLRPRTSYRARVLDSEGRPAQGVPLTLAVPGEPRLDRLPATAVTGADGTAVLYEPPAEALVGLRRIPVGTERVALARVASKEPIAVLVDPVGTGVVSLPSSADMTLRLTHSGFPADHWGGVLQLFPARNGSRSDVTLAVPVVGSEATLRYVERGVDLRAVVVVGEDERLLGSFAQLMDGVGAEETSPAREVSLDRGVFIEGRLVDGEGKPRAGASVQAMVEGEPSTTWSLATGPEGRFRWLVAAPSGAGRWSAVRIGGRRDGVTVPLPAFTPGDRVALGDVRLPR